MRLWLACISVADHGGRDPMGHAAGMSFQNLGVTRGIEKRRVQIPAIAGLVRTNAVLLPGVCTHHRELVGPPTEREQIAAIDRAKHRSGADHCRQRQDNKRKARDAMSSGPGAHWSTRLSDASGQPRMSVALHSHLRRSERPKGSTAARSKSDRVEVAALIYGTWMPSAGRSHVGNRKHLCFISWPWYFYRLSSCPHDRYGTSTVTEP